MRNRKNTDVRCHFEVDDVIRKAGDRAASNWQIGRHSSDPGARTWHRHNPINGRVNGIEELDAKVLASSLMSQPEKVHARVHSIDERLARLRMEKNRLIARAGHAERKRDTRRKILIGGAVLAAIEHEGVQLLKSKAELLRWLDAHLTRSHDRAVFELPPHDLAAAKLQPSAV